MNYLKIALLSILISLNFGSRATEGMWIPTLLQAVEDDMQAMGLKLSAEDIYSVNQSSLKDAIVHFGGGCTAELISSQGLLLTNHHCGYSQIQSHSSLENNYLKNGFWAKDFSSELPNEGLTATIIDRIEDVTDQLMVGITDDMDSAARSAKLKANVEAIEQGATVDGLEGVVRAYNYGNSYFLIVTKTFKDVRLVGTPPDAVGKFGGDTDNWVWPRHTGDFSIFRIYADENNEPAEYARSNKPYTPKQHLKVSLNGVDEGDFTMVFGFPGRTEQYLTSEAVRYVMEESNPMKIKMRDESLAIIDAAMRADEATKIKYASKQSGISNAWKKWKGQSRGLLRMDALNVKKDLERMFTEAAVRSGDTENETLIEEINNLQVELKEYKRARELFIEYYYYGPEILSFAKEAKDFGESALEEEIDESKLEELKSSFIKRAESHFKDYDVEIDKKIFKVLTPLYSKHLDNQLEPTILLQGKEDWSAFTKSVFKNKTLTNKEACIAWANGISKGKVKKLKKSLASKLSSSVVDVFYQLALPDYRSINGKIDQKMKTFVSSLARYFPDKDYWADANSTLRLTYGKAEGSEPADGMIYKFYTTADGILDKHIKGLKDYELPEDLVELLKKEDYGRYADENGELRVCFTGSNHTTGGNSGSPALNEYGHLIGLNFDRSWESTMSDIMFDPEQCRNIMVDIKYVLFIIDKYAGATRLIDEMDLTAGDGERKAREVSRTLDEGVLLFAEQMPYFKACENKVSALQTRCTQDELIAHIRKNIDYPKEAKKNNVEGKVVVSIVVGTDGKIKKSEVIRSSDNLLLDNEALRVVNTIPELVPAQNGGKPVKVSYNIPVAFSLD